jgi:copper transport protein
VAAVLLAVLTSVLLVATGVTPALAHAVLVEAVPADRSALPGPPDGVRLTFSEPVEVTSGALRVFDADAQRVDLGPRVAGDPAVVAVALPPDLPDGGYVATYRVTSADSHVVAGVLTFTVGDAPPVGDDLVAELFGGAGGDLSGVLGPALRGLGYVATLFAAGAVVIAAGVLRLAEDRARARRLARAAAGVGVAAALLAVPVHVAAVTGTSLLGSLAPGVLGEVAATSFATATVVRLVGLVALLANWRPGADRSAWQLLVPGLAGALVLGSFVLDGHQRSMEPQALLVAADAVHLTAGAVWFAGLVLLVPVLRRPAIEDERSAGAAPGGAMGAAPGAGPGVATGVATGTATGAASDAARVVSRFSTVALVAAVAVLASGLAMSSVLVGAPGALVSTGYGRTLLLKVGAVGVVLLLAAVNRRRLVPAIERRDRDAGADAAWRALRRTVRAEALLVVMVLFVTGTLVSQRPAAVEAGLTGSLQTAAPLTDELTVDLVVDPNRAGRNTLHLYVVEPTGRPTDTVEDLSLELTFVPEGIGPIELELFPVGPGHWTGTVDAFAFPGAWEVRVVAAVGRFDEASVTLPITVAP